MNPKTTQNWNPTRTQKLPKSYPSWVLIGFIWVPTGFRWVPQKGFRWGPVGFRLGSNRVPLGSIEEKTQIVPYGKCESMSKLTQLDPNRDIYKCPILGHSFY